MSRAYRIAVKESLSRHVQVEDGVSSKLELLPLLSRERLAALLAAELEQRGFKREGQRASRDEGGGTSTTVDLDTGEVQITAQGHAQLELEERRAAVIDSDHAGLHEKALREGAREELAAQAAAEEEALRQRVTRELEGRLKDLKVELDGVVNRVTATALKQRAAELGTVEEVHEEPNGGLTIKVRV